MFSRLFRKRKTLDSRHFDRLVASAIPTILSDAGVPRFHKALPQMHAELQRARRYGRVVTLALFGGGDLASAAALSNSGEFSHLERCANIAGAGAWAGERSGGPDDVVAPALAAACLRELVRDLDIVTYSASISRCVVLMPEIGADEARLAIDRLCHLCEQRFALAARADVAIFPEDGLTIDALIRAAADNRRPSMGPVLVSQVLKGA